MGRDSKTSGGDLVAKRNIFKLNHEQFKGLNDNPNYAARPATHARVFNNAHRRADAIEKELGRSLIGATTFANARGIIVSPEPNPVIELNSTNNTVYFYGGSSAANRTAILATGKYYSYTDLATALQTALTAGDATATYTVSFSTSTRKFTIGANHAFTLQWYGTYRSLVNTDLISDEGPEPSGNPTGRNSTLDAPYLFGFRYNTTSDTSHVSDFAVPLEPPNDIYVGQTTSLNNSAGTAITLPDTTAVKASNYNWSSIWFNKKCYLSNGADSYIMRDGKYIRKYPNISGVHNVSCPYIDAATKGIYFDSTRLSGSFTALPKAPVRIPISINSGITNNTFTFINHLEIKLKETAPYDTKPLNLYWEMAGTDYRQFIKTIDNNDIGGVTRVVNITCAPGLPINNKSTGANPCAYLVIEQDEYVKDTNVQIELVASGGGTIPKLQQYSETTGWADTANWICNVVVSCQKVKTLTSNSAWRYKETLENAEGYETPLSTIYLAGGTIGSSPYDLLMNGNAVLPNGILIDAAYINIYRTIENPTATSAYYLVGRIPASQALSGTDLVIAFVDGLTDAQLITCPEADVATVLDPPPPYILSWFWDDKHWIVPTANQDVLYYSEADMPDTFDLGNQYNKVGYDSAAITSLAPIADRMVVFKRDSVWMVFPSGTSYGIQQALQKGIGTYGSRSTIPAPTKAGNLVFFQGGDGHFYMTNGYETHNLSCGILESLVASLNLSALDKTTGFYNARTQEAIWSICTGNNTTPNKNLVWHTDLEMFYTSDYPSAIWATDGRNDTYPNRILPLGIHPTAYTLFYGFFSDTQDYGTAMTSTYRTADLDFGNPADYKNYACLQINAYAEAHKLMQVNTYIDGSSVPNGSYYITLNTDPAIIRLPINGTGRYISVELVDSDSAGWWRLSDIQIEFFPIFRVVM